MIFSHILLAKNERTFLPEQLYTSSFTSMHLSHHERASRREKRVVAAGTTVSFGRFPWLFSEKAVPLRPIRARARAQIKYGRARTFNYSSFASMLTSCNTKPQRGVTRVLEVSSVPLGRAASRFRSAFCDASRLKNGWCKADRKKRAFRYATSNPCRVPTARYPSTSSLPAIEMAGYHCLMPTASQAKLELIIWRSTAKLHLTHDDQVAFGAVRQSHI